MSILLILSQQATAAEYGWTRAGGGTDGTITDDGTTVFEFNVNQDSGKNNIELQLALFHDYMGDLTITLDSPNGTSVELFTNLGPSGNDVHCEFKDAIFNSTPCGGSGIANRIGEPGWDDTPFNLTYQIQLAGTGVTDFDDFKEIEAPGTWTLTIVDNYDDGYYEPGNPNPNKLYSDGQAWENGDPGTSDGTKLLVTPEPATVSVLVLGGMVLLIRRRRRRV